jgi:hypothetical protein
MQVAAVADHESRMLLKTFRDEGRAGLSSGLIRRGSRASAGDPSRPQLQVTDRAGSPRAASADSAAAISASRPSTRCRYRTMATGEA